MRSCRLKNKTGKETCWHIIERSKYRIGKQQEKQADREPYILKNVKTLTTSKPGVLRHLKTYKWPIQRSNNKMRYNGKNWMYKVRCNLLDHVVQAFHIGGKAVTYAKQKPGKTSKDNKLKF